MNSLLAPLLGGLFGFGLALSGMTDTNIVLGFLDLAGQWVPTLLFVMGGALTVSMLGFRLLPRLRAPLFASEFQLPTNRVIDARLLTGAALFGVGWGIYGYCPGPAVTAIAYGDTDTLLFVFAMLLGMGVASRL